MAGLKVSVHTNFTEELTHQLAAASNPAEHAVAVQVANDTEPFVPALTKSLVNRTKVDGGYIIYPGPYARYLYHGKVMVNSATGKGPSHFVDKFGNEQFRFPEGSKLKPIDRDLKINRSVHRLAQSHWFEASKAQNLDKWLQAAKKEVKRYL